MWDILVDRIRDRAKYHPIETSFPAASQSDIEKAEMALGFKIPELLAKCYVDIGNGGFGPGYGLIGVAGGAESDFGDVVGTYRQLRMDYEKESNVWPLQLLPICDWGCNELSCVNCDDRIFEMHLFREGEIVRQGYGIVEFFERWISDAEVKAVDPSAAVSCDIVNPFTGRPARVNGRIKP
jgi:hypothetical protein